jgi:hypothetical protein
VTSRRRNLPPLEPEYRRLVAEVIAEHGERGAAALLDCAPITLCRAAAGIGLFRATSDVLRVRLDAVRDRRRPGGGK